MDIMDIFLVTLCIGMLTLLVGVCLLVLSFVLRPIGRKHACKNVIDKLLIRTSFILETGLLLFIVAIAGLCILQAKEGFKTGTYYLILKSGAGFTKVSWNSEPVRFAIYSIGFIGFPIWSIYFTVKTIRSFMKKS